MVCGIPVPPTSSCSRRVTSSRFQGKHWSCDRRCPDGHLRSHAGQTTSGTGREDRGELLYPRPDPGSTPAPAKRKAGGNKISGKEILVAIRLMDAEERRELTRACSPNFSLFYAKESRLCKPCAERPTIREMCKWCAESVQPLSYIKKRTPNLTI